MDTLETMLKKAAHDTIDRRLRSWVEYEFYKKFLPDLIEEIKKSVRIELVENAKIPKEIQLMVKYVEPT